MLAPQDGNRRAEQDCLPGLRSLGPACAPASCLRWAAYAGSWGMSSPARHWIPDARMVREDQVNPV